MWKSWRLAIAATLFSAVVVLNLFPISDPDLWWHLKTGQLIWRTLSIPRVDPFSYTINGSPWVSFEWLSQIIFWAVFALGGVAAVTGFKAVVVALAFTLFFRLGKAGLWAGMALCAAAWSSGAYSERPHIFDPLFLGLILNWLDENDDPLKLWPRLCALSAVWANMHGGAALLGVGAVGLKFLSRRDGRWLAAAFACAAAMMINPHGLRIFINLSQTLAFPGREFIVEWRPLPGLLNRHGLFYGTALAAVCLGWKKDLPLCLLTAGLAAMAAWAVRYLPLFELSAAALAARVLENRFPLKIGPRQWAAAAAAALACGFFGGPTRGARREFPEGAAQFLDQRKISGRMFNEYNLGGYFIWKGRPVFVDGRNAEYGAEFIRAAVHWYEPAMWASLNAKWSFDYAVIENAQAYRAGVLDGSRDWTLAYWDDAALVYLRRAGADAELIPKTEYKLLKPNELSYGYLAPLLKNPKTAEPVFTEIERAVGESEQNDNARLMRAYALELLGRAREALPDLEAAVRHSPEKPGPRISLAWWLAANGDVSAARAAYQKALELAQAQDDALSQAYIYDNLGALESRSGNGFEAARLFRKSLAARPDYAPALEHLRRLESAAAQ